MAANETEYTRIVKDCKIGARKNLEWHVQYYFENSNKIKPEVIENLKSQLGKDYLKATLYSYAKLYEQQYAENQLDIYSLAETLTPELAIKLAKEEFEEIHFPFVKNHPTMQDYFANFDYKNKIHCMFPAGKKWISEVLMLYKHHLYTLFQNTKPYYNYSIEPLKFLLNEKAKATRVPAEDNLSGHQSVDMYKLVFEKDISALYNVYPNYQPTDFQYQLLELAHTTSMTVLNDLGLSHTTTHPDNFKVKEFYTNTGIIDLIDKYLKSKE